MSGRERRALAASMCPACSGPIRKGDPVHAWRGSLFADAHQWCYEKDQALDAAERVGTTGKVSG